MERQALRIESRSGLRAELNANGSLRRMDCDGVAVNLFPGNELEGGPTNVWLRRHRAARCDVFALLGPRSSTSFRQASDRSVVGAGRIDGLAYRIALVLAPDRPVWSWRISIVNEGDVAELDLIYAQDLALAPYAAVRINEYYVSQYVDHTPLDHPERGVVIASRQNQAVNGRYPWCAIGSLGRGVSFATDALQVFGLSQRAGATPPGLASGLPGHRLQHEHSMAALQDAVVRIERGGTAQLGFCGVFIADHPAGTAADDVRALDGAYALTDELIEASSPNADRPASSLFTCAPALVAEDLHEPQYVELFGAQRHHEERDEDGRLLSFFCGDARHVALKAKELCVQRPHGHLLRTGSALTVDETALTSTTWMNGVFHSMLTQGHVSINRFLSTARSYLGLFRSHGLRVFAQIDGEWRLLDTPSAYEMSPVACRWIYRHARGQIEVISAAQSEPHAMTLQITTSAPLRFLITHHIALNGDDGETPGLVEWAMEGSGVAVRPMQGGELHARFPQGSFLIEPWMGTTFERVGGDELLFEDGRPRGHTYICVVTAAAQSVGIRIVGRLVSDAPTEHTPGAHPGAPVLAFSMRASEHSARSCQIRQLSDIAPWFIHNALIHYLSPRGLEQFSGGGWGVRDVCQGPVELLLSFGATAPVRDLLLRVMRAQNPDGDWPQWFMFFERERAIRAGDSHGDVVFWPLLALAHYLIASGDAAILDEVESFFTPHADSARESGGGGDRASVWEHVQRALALIERRVVDGTALAAYGHGDWNDSLQPADPSMREHMCSAWTVTLHHQTLATLARALRAIGRSSDAVRLESQLQPIRSDFQRLLVVDDVLAGYALFEGRTVRYLLHPRDDVSGVRYSSLAMIHAILEDMLTPEQARAHLRLIEQHLLGPDGLRLFDRPMRYHGGPQRFFLRAESATFFGREIGLMYMHAHLRYAQALAHVGDAERFFHALCQANPIGIRELVAQTTLRQSNCYYSSSDAAFADRYAASEQYQRVFNGEVALDGGWRVYSSGAGIATSLIVRRLLGMEQQQGALIVDPVMPTSIDGLQASLQIYGTRINITYRIRGAGCGVSQVRINDAPIRFERDANPYRPGAARILREHITTVLRADSNSMEIDIG